MWNRMFEQRVIWDYDTAGFEKICALPGGRVARVVLRVREVRPRLPGRPRRRLRPPQDPPQGPDGHGSPERPGPVALHDVHELPPGLPEGGRHDQDHAGRPGGGGGRGRRALRAAGRVREDLPLRQLPRRERPQAPRLDQDGRRAGAGAVGVGPRPGRRAGVGRGLLELPPPRPGGGPGLRPGGDGAGRRLGHRRPGGEDHGRLAAAGGGEGPLRGDDGRRRGHAGQVPVQPDRDARPPRLQRLHQGLPEVRARVRGAALHPAAGPADGPGGVRRTSSTSTSPSTTPATSDATAASTTPPGSCSSRSPA